MKKPMSKKDITVVKKCEECWAHYTGEHECFGLMKMLVQHHKNKNENRNNGRNGSR